jgi:hypothetical protein
MRFPPLLTINNFVKASDEAYVAETFQLPRFPVFGMDVSVIGPWLSASFDNPAFPTGAPIMRLTLVGAPPQRIRTVNDDEHGTVLMLADGAGGQRWEVVSKVEWVADGETAIAWVFCFCRPLAGYPLVSGSTCEASPDAPLNETFILRADPTTDGHAKIAVLPPGVYTVQWSTVQDAPGPVGFTSYTGSCQVVGIIGSNPMGTMNVTVSAGNTLRLYFASATTPARCYVFVTSPP